MSDQPAHGTHDYADDPRNDAVLVYVNGELKPREQAVSVFDAGFVLGDGVGGPAGPRRPPRVPRPAPRPAVRGRRRWRSTSAPGATS